MRLSIVLVILRKELLETLRDRRTFVSLVLLPMMLYPLFALLMSRMAGAEMDALEARPSKIAVWGELSPDVSAALAAGENKLDIMPWHGVPAPLRRDLEAGAIAPPVPAPPRPPGPPRKGANAEAAGAEAKADTKTRDADRPDAAVALAARALVGAREVHAVLVPWRGFSEDVRAGKAARVTLYYDSVWGDSDFAADRLDYALARARDGLLVAREGEKALPKGFTSGLEVVSRNVAPDERRVGKVLGTIMPMMLILMSLLGGFLRAADMTAGEKERGTMQTLLCAPLLPIEIITGKFLAVSVVSLFTALVNVASLGLTLRRILPGEMDVPFSAHVLTFALLVPVTLLFSALFLAVAAFARDFKDAQNLLTPVYLPVMLLSMVTSLPGMELSVATSFVPVLNVALLIKAIYLGDVAPDLVLFTIGSSTLFAALTLVFAARVFEREDVLLGGRGSFRAVFSFERQKGGIPSLGFSLGAFAVVLVVMFYASFLVEKTTNKTAQLAATQLGLFFLPALAAIAASGASMRETLGLRFPRPRALVGAVLAGLSGGAAVAAIATRLVPVPPEFADKLGDALLLDGQPLWVLLIVIAVLPALCEETLFRGLLFSGLTRAGFGVALVASSLLFGLAHGSIYRLLPTFSLGLLLGYARHETRSLLPGILVHGINNALAITILAVRPPWLEKLMQNDQVPVGLGVAAALVLALGVVLMREPRKADARG
ncbi:ABC transporter permease subunit/CPBP intramembrane protease [Polyangium sorediatum]|uniref:ABC transporter permease subunit/CPBP intramembrane protease n=1 Tax=Polyangium sorediatum TaxID=889274 RepID=A0ABT6NMK4_9BACT|nr:ABC transporter permease subunit/CPBP intramembrane protease [Polyangium sorediatum]MDI1429528.1 ABC transporter permease subunit/CPBP intramembrane protease [Polyangium sorediatum]